jgi:hypothetical protein
MSERVKFVYVATNFSLFNMWSEKPSGFDFAQKNKLRKYRELKIPQTAKKISEWGDRLLLFSFNE